MRTLTKISVAPVKGLALRHPEQVQLEAFGVAINRRFYMIDARGRLADCSKHARLVAVQADYEPQTEWLALRFPDGAVAEGDAGPAHCGERVETNFHGRRHVPAAVLDGPWSAALSAYVGEPVRLVRPDQPGNAVDVEPLSLISTASVEELVRQSGKAAAADSRRFRMLLEFGGCSSHEEDGWDGVDVRIGDAIVRGGGPIPRCVVTTRDPSSGLPDVPTLHVIRAYRGLGADGQSLDFGVYGQVVEPGTVRLGDPVEVLARVG